MTLNCRVYDSRWLMVGVAKEMRRVAFLGVWDGGGLNDYLRRASGYHAPTGTKICFTRDKGGHSSGWWKNPDYERCLHLSLSFYDRDSRQPVGDRDLKLTEEWLSLFFGNNRRLLWAEPPSSELGKKLDVWHYRLMVYEDWVTPLLPRGEVYSKEHTESGWLSYSELQARNEVVLGQLLGDAI
jgi:hypothetical protein